LKAKSAPIHAVLGTDDTEVKRVARELAAELAPPGDFGMDVIDGQAGNSGEAAERIYRTIDALQTFGFFGGEKLVWLKDANFLADDRTGAAQATLDALEKLTSLLQGGLPDGTRFLLSAGAVDKRRSFFRALNKLTEPQICDRIDPTKQGWEQAAAVLVRDLAGQKGLRLDEEARDLFTLYTGGDRPVIASELEKLDLYLGPKTRTATVDDVRMLTPMSRAGVIFELGNAISARRLQHALELLRQLLFGGEKAIGILLATIIPTVRNLLLVKDLMVRHRLAPPSNPFNFGRDLDRLPTAATAHLPRTKEGKVNAFALGFAAIGARHFTLPELQAGLKSCLAANVALVSASTEAEVVLSQLLVRLIGGGRPAATSRAR
jgi:DNA polymerase-3 subunit delta